MTPERPTIEEVSQLYSDPQSFASEHHGIRVEPMEMIEIPLGWVVNGKLSPELWDKIRAITIPLMPGLGESEAEKKARGIIDEIKEKYSEEVFFLMVRDDEAFGNWSARPIFVADLDKDPETLMKESHDARKCKKPGWLLKTEMKRCVLMAITGWVDTNESKKRFYLLEDIKNGGRE